MKRLAIFSLVLFAACTDEKKAPSINEPIPSGEVQAVVQRVAEYGRDSVVFRVHVGAKDVEVGAYQGRLSFDPAALQVLAVRVPSIEGEFRVINKDSLAAGAIPFAAFTAEAFKETQVFEILAKPIQDLAAAKLIATLSVVGQPTGTAVEARRIRRNDGVRDAQTNALIVRSR